jgi:hypothetical protein
MKQIEFQMGVETTKAMVNHNECDIKEKCNGIVFEDSPTLDEECTFYSMTEEMKVAIVEAFSSIDISKNGLLEKDNLANFLDNAAKRIQLRVPSSVIIDAVEALMDDLGASNGIHITKEQFLTLFIRHPELLRCFDHEAAAINEMRRASQRSLTREEIDEYERENEETWEAMPQ